MAVDPVADPDLVRVDAHDIQPQYNQNWFLAVVLSAQLYVRISSEAFCTAFNA
jgi:hypothetical protein